MQRSMRACLLRRYKSRSLPSVCGFGVADYGCCQARSLSWGLPGALIHEPSLKAWRVEFHNKAVGDFDIRRLLPRFVQPALML